MYDGNLRSIVEENNDDYARTSDGYLRIKHIYHTSVGEFLVMHVEYGLYDYIPQNPKSSFNSYTIGTYNIQRASRRPYNTFSAEDEYIDTEIGFQQIEGCKKSLWSKQMLIILYLILTLWSQNKDTLLLT